MQKIKINKSLLASAVFLGGFLSSTNVFAANIYNMNYTGGEALGANNVTIDKPLIDGLTPLIKKSDGSNLKFSNYARWENGYVKWGDICDPIRYIRVWQDESLTSGGNMSYSITGEKYISNIGIKNIVLENLPDLAENGNKVTIGVNRNNGWLFVGFPIYPNAQCETGSELANITNLSSTDGGRIFVETNIKLNKIGDTDAFVSNELYFGITDIDQAQSFKILNEGSKLTKNNMFAESAAALQPPEGTLKNMYVASNNYIYSEYDGATFNNSEDVDVLVKIDPESQVEGLKVVYGFAKQAGSGLDYFAKQYVVNYKSDKNGAITGIKKEDVIAGLNPTGSTEKPNEGYVFTHWIADVDITLKDGTVIKKGNKITSAQIKNVVVSSDITFTAINDTDPGVTAPDTGFFTGQEDNAPVILGIALPVSAVVIAVILHIIERKKHAVRFN